MLISYLSNRLVVKPEAQTPPSPSHNKTSGREKVAFASASLSGASPCLTHSQLLEYATAPALSRTVLDARCESVGWNPFVGCAFALAASAGIRSSLASCLVQ